MTKLSNFSQEEFPLSVLADPLSTDVNICAAFELLLGYTDAGEIMTTSLTNPISVGLSRHLITVLMSYNLIKTKKSIKLVMSVLPSVNISVIADLMLRQPLRDLFRRIDPTNSIKRFYLLDRGIQISAIARYTSMNPTDVPNLLDS